MDPSNFELMAGKFLNQLGVSIGVKSDQIITFEYFRDWFEAHNTTGKSLWEMHGDDFAPVPSSAHYFRKFAGLMTRFREQHIDTIIADALSRCDLVLTVYGAGHLKMSRPVFEKMLGPGTSYTLV